MTSRLCRGLSGRRLVLYTREVAAAPRAATKRRGWLCLSTSMYHEAPRLTYLTWLRSSDLISVARTTSGSKRHCKLWSWPFVPMTGRWRCSDAFIPHGLVHPHFAFRFDYRPLSCNGPGSQVIEIEHVVSFLPRSILTTARVSSAPICVERPQHAMEID